jgi:hypothetical protein
LLFGIVLMYGVLPVNGRVTFFSYPFSSSFLRRKQARSCPSSSTTCSKAVSHSSVSWTSASLPPVYQFSGVMSSSLMLA